MATSVSWLSVASPEIWTEINAQSLVKLNWHVGISVKEPVANAVMAAYTWTASRSVRRYSSVAMSAVVLAVIVLLACKFHNLFICGFNQIIYFKRCVLLKSAAIILMIYSRCCPEVNIETHTSNNKNTVYIDRGVKATYSVVEIVMKAKKDTEL